MGRGGGRAADIVPQSRRLPGLNPTSARRCACRKGTVPWKVGLWALATRPAPLPWGLSTPGEPQPVPDHCYCEKGVLATPLSLWLAHMPSAASRTTAQTGHIRLIMYFYPDKYDVIMPIPMYRLESGRPREMLEPRPRQDGMPWSQPGVALVAAGACPGRSTASSKGKSGGRGYCRQCYCRHKPWCRPFTGHCRQRP